MSTEIEEGKNDQTFQDEELATLSVIVQVFGDDGEGNDDGVSGEGGEITGEDEGETKAVWRASAIQLQSPDDVSDLVKDIRDKISARLVAKREAAFREACEQVELDFPIPDTNDKDGKVSETASKASITKKSVAKKKKKKKKKNPVAEAQRKRQEALDAVPRPLKPVFAVRGLAFPGAFDEKRAKEEVTLESSWALAALYQEWRAVHSQRQELLTMRAFRDLLDILARHGTMTDTILFEVFQLLQNESLERFAWDPLCAFIRTLAKRRPSRADSYEVNRYLGLAAWAVTRHVGALRDSISKERSPMTSIVPALKAADSLRSSKPTTEALYYVCAAAALSSFVEEDEYCRSTEAQGCFADLGRRANDGVVLLGSLVILNNTLAAYIKSDKISDDAKRAIMTKVTNHFASPQLIVHDVETKGSLARTDLSTIVLASSAVTKACTDLPLHVSADLLCRSGALRRILALADWAYQGLIMSATTEEGEEEQLEALGDFVVPGSAAVLSSYVTQLRKVCSLEDKKVDSRPTIVRVVLLQTMFLLSTAVWNIQDQMELTAPNRALFLELAKLFCKTANMVRVEWVVISEAKNAERALKAKAAEEAAELAALRALETGQPAQGNGAETDDDPATSGADHDASDIHVEEHPLEWILGDTERCALVGLRSLLEARYISAEDIAEHLLPGHLSHIAAFLECITPRARQCSIDVLNRFLIAFEEMKDAKRAKAHLCEVSSGVEPVLVVDTLLAHPNEDNVAFLLCRVMKYTPDVAAAEILSNVLTLIDHRTMFISAHKGRQEAADLLIVTYLLEVVKHAAECPSRRRLMGTSEGGSAVEVLLASLSRLLALPGRPFHVHECVVHVCMALTLILQDVQNAETFVDARGVQMLCAMVEEFASASAHVHPGPEKTSHYEVLIHALKLWRVIIMTRSVHFQRATLSAEVMDTLFTTCCAPYEEDLPQYLKSAAQSKRLAASILAALPFKREVSEPALIAVARRFICQDYRQCLCIAVEQQSFGAQLFSRVEISETGHELLRRSKVVKSLVQFACHEVPADASPADRASNDVRKQSALIGLLYLCAEDAKTQVYVCTTALYRLLKLAWTSQQANFQHALVGRLLEQLALNKLNRTKLFKAEMRARAVAHRAHVGHYASEEEKAASDAMTSMRRHEARSQEKEEKLDAYDSFEEASAAGELHELIRLRHEYSQWLDKETGKKAKKYASNQKLKVVPGTDASSPRQQQQQQQQQQQEQNGKHARNKSPTRIPALERPEGGKSHPPRETLESSKLWVFKDPILTPQANLSSVANSNGRSPRDAPVGGLFQALNQPMKLLWTNRGIVETLEVSREIPLREGAPLGTLKTDKLWQFKESADPFQALVSRIPVPAYIADMDVPDLVFLREARGSMLAPTPTEINDLDNEDTASAVVSPVSLKYWVPGICCLGAPPHPAAVVRPRTGFGAEKWVSRVKQLKSWDVDGSLVPLPVDLRVRDIAAISIAEEGQAAVAEEPAATLETFRDKHYENIVGNALTGVDVECALDALCPLFLYYSARPTLDVRSLFEDLGLEPLAKKDTTPKTLASFLEIVRLRLESGSKTAQNIADSLWSKFGEKDLILLFAWERQKARLAPILRDHSPLLQSIGSPDKLCSALEMAGTIPEEDLQLARAMASPFAEIGVDATAAADIDVDVDAAIGVALCWLAPALVKEPIRLYDDAQIIAQEEKKAAAKRGRRAQEQAQSDQDDKAKEEEQNVPLARALRLLLAHLYQAHNLRIDDTSA